MEIITKLKPQQLKSRILISGFSDNKLFIIFIDFPPFHKRKAMRPHTKIGQVKYKQKMGTKD